MTRFFALMAASFLALAPGALEAADSPAQDGAEAPAEQTAPTEASPGEAKRQLTPEETAEKEARKECKKKICDIVATRDPNGENVSCDIVKTWREEDIVKMLGGKVSWPWGKAVCQSKLDLERKSLALAMSENSHEIVMPVQKVRCTLAQKTEGEPYTVEVTLAPEVKFENEGDGGQHQLGRGDGAASDLSADLRRHRSRQQDQCARARGRSHGQRVRHQEMHRGKGGSACQQPLIGTGEARLKA